MSEVHTAFFEYLSSSSTAFTALKSKNIDSEFFKAQHNSSIPLGNLTTLLAELPMALILRVNDLGFVRESLRKNLAQSMKTLYLESLDDGITFDNWLGVYLTRKRSTTGMMEDELHQFRQSASRQFSVRSPRGFDDANSVLSAFMSKSISLRRQGILIRCIVSFCEINTYIIEDVRITFMGRDDKRGMQSLFINEDIFFLPPPLNKFVGAVLCAKRQLIYESVEDYLKVGDADPVIERVRLESSPFFRLLSSLIQRGYFYPVDII